LSNPVQGGTFKLRLGFFDGEGETSLSGPSLRFLDVCKAPGTDTVEGVDDESNRTGCDLALPSGRVCWCRGFLRAAGLKSVLKSARSM